jgi:hypothetical protein
MYILDIFNSSTPALVLVLSKWEMPAINFACATTKPFDPSPTAPLVELHLPDMECTTNDIEYKKKDPEKKPCVIKDLFDTLSFL